MEDIINQIVQIDFAAINVKQQNEALLKSKQEQYEETIKAYKETVLKKANERAEELYCQIVESGTNQYQVEEEKSKQISLIMENRYLQMEKALLDKLFNELFTVEG